MRLQRSRHSGRLDQLAASRVAGSVAMATLGAMAVAAVAISRLFVRRLSFTTARISHMEGNDLVVRRSRVREFVRDDVPPPPIR